MDSMISSAARAKSELIEAKQQINVLESHSRRFASERESLYSQIEVLKVKFLMGKFLKTRCRARWPKSFRGSLSKLYQRLLLTYCPSILGLLDYDDKIKERLANLQKDHERQGDDLLREQTLRKSELAKIKIDNLESKLDQGI